MPTYDYSCESGHTTEARRDISVVDIPCPICGNTAKRSAIYLYQSVSTESGLKLGRKAKVPKDEKYLAKPFKLFREACEENDYAHKKLENNVGHPVKSPSLWKTAKRRAKRIQAGLEAPLKGV